MLQAIASNGIVPLFTYWANSSRPKNEPVASEWMCDLVVSEYVQHTASLKLGEKKTCDHLPSMTGIARIFIGGPVCQFMTVQFDPSTVTVLTMWDTPQIRCETIDRDTWTGQLMKAMDGDAVAYGKAILMTDEEIALHLEWGLLRNGIKITEVTIEPMH